MVLHNFSQFWTVFPSFGWEKLGKTGLAQFILFWTGKIGFGREKPNPDDTANDNPADVSIVESSQSSDLHFDDPDESDGPAPLPAAGVDGSAGQGNPAATPVGGPDVSSLMGTSTPPLFPSMPKTIDQSTLVDFISMWTLLQGRLDQPSVQDNSSSPPVQSSLPVSGHDSTNRRSVTPAGSPERRPKSPERFLHTPQSSIILSPDRPRRPRDRPGLP